MKDFKYNNVLLGADPELFLKDKATGKYVPSCDLIGGSKEKPKKIDKKGHAVQEDNVMVEYNIRPAKNADQWVQSHEFVLDYLRKSLPQFDLAIEASAVFPKALLDHPKAKVFGCDPDYNAWTMTVNPPPNPNTDLRTSGGHVHFGYDKSHISNQVPVARAFDLFVTVPSVLLDPDERRRTRYGKAGAFRPKDYGVECRGTSNFWIGSEKLMRWVYGNSMGAIEFLNSGKGMKTLDKLANDVQACINKGDKAIAEKLSKEFGLLQGV